VAEQMLPLPIQFLLPTISAAINERMARQLEYAQEEVRTLKEALAAATETERIRFTDEQRRRLAVKGKALTPRERAAACQIVRPETILGLVCATGPELC
jgi:phage host-nuclease inhibitor protein Gam